MLLRKVSAAMAQRHAITGMPREATAAVPRDGTVRMVSQIDPRFPVYATPTTLSVRMNFEAAKDEIEDLQNGKLDLAGGQMTGPIGLVPTQLLDGGTF
jgi:hypothetical protein